MEEQNLFSGVASGAKTKSISIPQLRALFLDLNIGVNSQTLLDQVEHQQNTKTKNFILAKVKGIQRGFYRRGSFRGEVQGAIESDDSEYLTGALDLKSAFWGAAPIADATSYVMLTEVTREELQEHDAAQAGSYSNMWLTTSDVEVLGDDEPLPATAAVRWWPNKEENLRAGASPQIHSQVYIDEKLGGAIELGDIKNVPDFALGVVTTCTGWGEYPWVNDRATVFMPEENDVYARRVDALLWEAARTPGSELTIEHLEKIGFPGQAPHPMWYTKSTTTTTTTQ